MSEKFKVISQPVSFRNKANILPSSSAVKCTIIKENKKVYQCNKKGWINEIAMILNKTKISSTMTKLNIQTSKNEKLSGYKTLKKKKK